MPYKSWRLFSLVLTIFLLSISTSVFARDSIYMLPFKEVLLLPQARNSLDPNIRMYFGNQMHSAVTTRLGGYFSNRQGNALFKSDVDACRQVALSVLEDLQARARAVGANAIINIVSYYEKKPNSNDNLFECHSGSIVAGVALKGDMVNIAP